VVSANLLALQSKKVVGGVFNIGSGTSTTVYELANILQQITDTERLKPIFTESRAGDIKHCSGDIYKAEEILGFHPKIQLRDGLSKLVEWHLHSTRAIERSVL
jgi:dTDP-L-rhamnose 4-epimerase